MCLLSAETDVDYNHHVFQQQVGVSNSEMYTMTEDTEPCDTATSLQVS